MTVRSLARLFTLVTATLLVAAPSASAAFSAPISGTSTLTAGSHPDITMTIQFPDTGRDVEDMDLSLPPGLLGNPNAVTPCTLSQVAATNCPSSAQVGTVWIYADIYLPDVLGGITLSQQGIGGTVYLMQPRGSETARMYTQIGPYVDGTHTMEPLKLETPIRLNSPGDYSLVTAMRTLPLTNTVYPFGWTFAPTTGYVQLRSMSMTLFGTRGNMSAPFMTAPTSCGPIRYSVDAKPYNSTTWVHNQSSVINVTGCESTPFTPGMSVSPTTVPADQPTGVSVTMTFPQPGTGIAQSTIKSTNVVLPEGFALSASSGSQGLAACSDAQFAASSTSTPTCPAASEVGTVSFVTPLIPDPVIGKVYVGDPAPGVPLRLLIHATAGAISLKLSSRAVTDPQTGQITTIFDDIPPIPFTSFTMNFRSGNNAMIKAPSTCGTGNAVAHMEPASRPGTEVALQASITTTDCVTPQFNPTLNTTFGGMLAGGDTSTTMSFSRTDADERFDSMQVSLPTGLLGRLASVERCSLADAQAAACGAGAQVGTVTVVAGTGPDPLTIDTGKVFLAEPEPGGVADLAITIPAKVGPIDLGTAVVLAKMTVRSDLGIDVSVGAMPKIIGGVPLFVRSMTLHLDREGFLFNASSCAERALSTTLGSTGGKSVTQATPYLPTDCSALAFAPTFSARLGGDIDHPSLTATMLPRPGDATMSSMAMTLPAGISADRKAFGNPCPIDTFNAGACPAQNRVGTATAVSPIIPDPLSGPVYLVRLPGEILPGLAVSLHGLIDLPITIVNSIGQGSRLTSTVQGIPDVPLTRFDLTLNGNSLLSSDVPVLCGGNKTMNAVFTGHNGSRSEASPTVAMDCAGGKKTLAPKPSAAKATGSLRRMGKGAALKLTLRGKAITGVRVTLPRSAVRVNKAQVRGAMLAKSGKVLIGRALTTTIGQAITVKVPAANRKAGVSVLSLDLAPAALRKAAGLKPGKAVALKLRVTHATGPASNLTLKLKAR